MCSSANNFDNQLILSEVELKFLYHNDFLSSIFFSKTYQMPIVKERRRFTDVMEEEQMTKTDKRVRAIGREDFSIYKLHRGEEELEVNV